VITIIVILIFWITSSTWRWTLSLWKLSVGRFRSFPFAFLTSLLFCGLTHFKSWGIRSNINSPILSLNYFTFIKLIFWNDFCRINFSFSWANCLCHLCWFSFERRITFILFFNSGLWSSWYRLWRTCWWPNIWIIYWLKFYICFWN
jgi:hypothetical protein